MGRHGCNLPEAGGPDGRRLIVPRRASSPSAAFDAAGIFVAAVSQYLVIFAANALLSRALGPQGRGVYYAPVLAAVTLLAFCKLGLDQVNVFLLGSRSLPASRLMGQNGFVSLWAGLLGCVGTVALHWVLPSVFGETPVLFLLLAGLTIPFGIHAQLSGGLLSLLGRPTWQYRAGLAGAVVQILLLGGLIATGRASPGSVLVVSLIAALSTWVVMNWPLGRIPANWYAVDLGLLKETLRSSLVLHVGMLLLFLHLRLDLFMVKAWLGTRALGHYSLTVMLGETLPLATEAVALAILPGQVANTLAEAGARALRASRATIALGTIFALGWVVLGAPLIRLMFGAEFLPSYIPLVVLLPGMILMGVQRTCGAPALRAGRPGIIVGIYAVSLACNVALNVWWIPRWGLIGASGASSVSYVICTFLFVAWTARLAGIPFHRALTPDRHDWNVLTAAVRQLGLLVRGEK
jgi:hypothetical protein